MERKLFGKKKKAAKPTVAILGTRGYPSYYGGFETAVRKLAPYLADSGWDVIVYGRRNSVVQDDDSLDPRITTLFTPGLDSRTLSTLTYGFTSVFDVARRKPDVALVMNVANGYWLPFLRARSVPTAVNVDGIEWERDKWSSLGKKVFRTGAKATAAWADRLVVDSLAIGEYWESEFGRNGDYIPYGGDEVGTLVLEAGLQSKKYALVVARFVPENSILEFFEAAREVSLTHDVVIVGSTGYGGALDEYAAELAANNPRIKWLGHVHDHQRLLSLWQHAGVYFHGHTVGGTNPALVQAMMCGAPTVARDTVFSREVLGPDARLVGSNPGEIARSLLEVLNDKNLQASLRERALKRARDSYSWEAVCEAYNVTLTSLIQGRR